MCRVGVTIKVRVKGVKRIHIDARRDHYAIEEIIYQCKHDHDGIGQVIAIIRYSRS